MTLAEALAHAPEIARQLRARADNTLWGEWAALHIEQARAVEIMAETCREDLKPGLRSELLAAEAMLDRALAMPADQVREFEIKTIAQKGPKQNED